MLAATWDSPLHAISIRRVAAVAAWSLMPILIPILIPFPFSSPTRSQSPPTARRCLICATVVHRSTLERPCLLQSQHCPCSLPPNLSLPLTLPLLTIRSRKSSPGRLPCYLYTTTASSLRTSTSDPRLSHNRESTSPSFTLAGELQIRERNSKKETPSPTSLSLSLSLLTDYPDENQCCIISSLTIETPFVLDIQL